MLIRYFKKILSPFFLSSFLLRRDIEKSLIENSFSGKILDIGCGSKPYEKLFQQADEYIGIDFPGYSEKTNSAGSKPDLFFGADYSSSFNLPFADHSFDCVVSFQVVEHHGDCDKYFSEISRIIREDGLIMLSAPFLGGVHEEPNDYQRLTEYGVKSYAAKNGLKVIKSFKQGNIFIVAAMLLAEKIDRIIKNNKTWLAALIFPLVALSIIERLLVIVSYRDDNIYYNSLFILKKYESKQK